MGKSEDRLDTIEAIAGEASRLIEHIRCCNAPEAVLQESMAQIRAAVETLEPWQHVGVYAASFLDKGWDDFTYTDNDLRQSMPYSPVTGKKNPVAPAIHLWAEGEKVRGSVNFSATFAGPPGGVHGGIIAAVFDELLAMVNLVNQVVGYTGTLNIRYQSLTPLHTDVTLYAECVRASGRKVQSRGEMRVGGELTASAEGLFIKPSGFHPTK